MAGRKFDEVIHAVPRREYDNFISTSCPVDYIGSLAADGTGCAKDGYSFEVFHRCEMLITSTKLRKIFRKEKEMPVIEADHRLLLHFSEGGCGRDGAGPRL